MRYPWVVPYLNGTEVDFVSKAVSSSWISGGPYVNELEEKLTSLLGASTLCVSNGTTALECALLSLDIGPGDEVIVPDFSFIAAAAMVKRVGADLVLADIDPKTWCLDEQDVKRKISPKTKAVIVVHTYGACPNLSALKDICEQSKVFLIEDAAESFLSSYNGQYLGTIGDVGTFSFHATKTLTTGEGGAVSFNSKEAYLRGKLIRDHGMEPTKRYWHPTVGNNFRMTNMQAAMGCAQLKTIEWVCKQRNEIYDMYHKLLSESKDVKLQTFSAGLNPIMWACGVFMKDVSETKRDHIITSLKTDGIETRPGFYPASKMPPYQSSKGVGNCPNSKELSERLIALPFYVGLKQEDIHWITNKFLQKIATP